MFEMHVTEHHLAQNGVHAGLGLQACQIVTHRGRRAGDTMTDALECVEVVWIDFLQDEIYACAPPKVLDGFAPARIGCARYRLRIAVSVGNNDVPGNSDARQRCTVARELLPFLAITIADCPGASARAKRYHVDTAWCCPRNRVCVGRAVPERRMWALHRSHLHHVVFVVVEAPFEIDHVGFERPHQHAESLVIHRGCQRGVDTEALMLDQRSTAAYAYRQATAAEMVEHANFFVEAQRMMKRKDVDQWPDPDLFGALDRRRQENARAGRHAKRRRMVFRHMIGVKPECSMSSSRRRRFSKNWPNGPPSLSR